MTNLTFKGYPVVYGFAVIATVVVYLPEEMAKYGRFRAGGLLGGCSAARAEHEPLGNESRGRPTSDQEFEIKQDRDWYRHSHSDVRTLRKHTLSSHRRASGVIVNTHTHTTTRKESTPYNRKTFATPQPASF